MTLTLSAPLRDFAIGLHTQTERHVVALRLDPSQMSQRFMIQAFDAQQFYETETTQFLGAILRPGDTFIDIGAHVGYFAMVAATFVGAMGSVYAFEPNAENYARLVEHIELNRAWQVQPLHLAVGDHEHVATFFINADNDGGHALWDVALHPQCEQTRHGGEQRRVFVTSLDRFLAERPIGSLRAIKIDAEGSEVAVLRGAARALERHQVPFVIAEVNRFGLEQMGTSERELRELMAELGYEAWVIVPGETQLAQLLPESEVETEYVFNLLFRRPGAEIG